jgi:hypothetical protein
VDVEIRITRRTKEMKTARKRVKERFIKELKKEKATERKILSLFDGCLVFRWTSRGKYENCEVWI